MTSEYRQMLKLAIDQARRVRVAAFDAEEREGQCQQCGVALENPKSNQRFCSTKCRKLWHNNVYRKTYRTGPVDELQPLAALLRAARQAKGVTQKELAVEMGIRKRNFPYWERGWVCPSEEMAAKLERALGISADVIAEFRLYGYGPAQTDSRLARLSPPSSTGGAIKEKT